MVVSTHLKNISQNGNLPQIGANTKNVWNHHPDKIFDNCCYSYRLVPSMGSRQSVLPLQLQKSLVTRFWRTTGTSTTPKTGTKDYPPIPPTTSEPFELQPPFPQPNWPFKIKQKNTTPLDNQNDKLNTCFCFFVERGVPPSVWGRHTPNSQIKN